MKKCKNDVLKIRVYDFKRYFNKNGAMLSTVMTTKKKNNPDVGWDERFYV